MIISPSVSSILRGIVHDINTNLKPGISDAVQLGQLDTIMGVLTACAIRSRYEPTWMAEEIDAVVKVTDRFSKAGLMSEELEKALKDLDGADTPQGKYQAASEALSCLSEIKANAELSSDVWSLMEQRLENETRVIGGGFEAAGRG